MSDNTVECECVAESYWLVKRGGEDVLVKRESRKQANKTASQGER